MHFGQLFSKIFGEPMAYPKKASTKYPFLPEGWLLANGVGLFFWQLWRDLAGVMRGRLCRWTSNQQAGPAESTENLLACHRTMGSSKPPDATGRKKRKGNHFKKVYDTRKIHLRNKTVPSPPASAEHAPFITSLKVICCHNVTFLRAMRPLAEILINLSMLRKIWILCTPKNKNLLEAANIFNWKSWSFHINKIKNPANMEKSIKKWTRYPIKIEEIGCLSQAAQMQELIHILPFFSFWFHFLDMSVTLLSLHKYFKVF